MQFHKVSAIPTSQLGLLVSWQGNLKNNVHLFWKGQVSQNLNANLKGWIKPYVDQSLQSKTINWGPRIRSLYHRLSWEKNSGGPLFCSSRYFVPSWFHWFICKFLGVLVATEMKLRSCSFDLVFVFDFPWRRWARHVHVCMCILLWSNG